MTSEWLADRTHRLHELAELQENWDSYGAHPPAEASVKQAETLLNLMAELDADAPHLYPTVDGGIAFEWTYPGWSVEIAINPDGKLEGWSYNTETHEERDF